jgi:hypothetical protein
MRRAEFFRLGKKFLRRNVALEVALGGKFKFTVTPDAGIPDN